MPKTVYLQPKHLVRHSRHHTAYAGDGATHKEGQPPALYRLEFINGVAKDVPEAIYQRFKDLGIADVKKPNLDSEDQ